MKIEIFFTKELVTKFVFGVHKSLSVTFLVQRSSCVIGCFGGGHYQLVMRKHFVKFIKPTDKSVFFQSFSHLKFHLKFFILTWMFFPRNLVPALWSCHN